MKLTEKQMDIVNSTEKYISVIAGAGSGKTTVVTARIAQRTNNLSFGQKILGITFSNKATEELKDRLIKTLGEEKTNEFTYIGTIHNFCNEILMNHGHLIGIPDSIMICNSNEDRMSIFKDALYSIPEFYNRIIALSTKDQKKQINEWLDYFSKLKRDLKFATDYEKSKPTYLLFKEFDDQLINQGMIDFDDIVRYAYKVLVSFPAVLRIYQRIYKEIYVDEAQDINLAQYEIVRLIAGDTSNIIMVGDPNQAIYGFSGGSSNFLKNRFGQDYKTKVYNLAENFRSAQSIVDAANKLESSFLAKGIYPLQGEFLIKEFNDEEDEALAVVNSIEVLLSEGHEDLDDKFPKASDFAVIARNRYVFKSLIQELEKRNIKFNMKVSPRGSFSSESDIMRVFELGLMLLGNDLDIIHLNELNNIFSTNNLKNVLDIDDCLDIEEQIRVKFKYVTEAIKTINVEEVNINTLLDIIEKTLTDNDLVLEDNERELIQGDIDFWRLNWKNYVKNSNVGNRAYASFIRRISLASSSVETKETLTLTTVHMAKGLEYSIVYIIGMNDGVFPDYRAINDINSGKIEQMNEEKHNLFVAITRAKRLCFVSYPKYRVMPWGDKKNQQPSRLLEPFLLFD